MNSPGTRCRSIGGALIALLVAAQGVGCSGCGPETLPRPRPLPPELTRAQPEPLTWGMTSVAKRVIPPFPCRARGDSLGAVADIGTRFAAAPNFLGELIVARGPGARDSAITSVGIVTMKPGRHPLRKGAWSTRATPIVSHAQGAWLVAVTTASSGGPEHWLWQPTGAELLGAGASESVADLSCRGDLCGMLMRGTRAGSVLRVGKPGQRFGLWSVQPLPRGPAFRLAGNDPWTMVSTPELGRIVFDTFDRDGASAPETAVTIVAAGEQPLDAIALPQPTVLTRAGEGEPSCESSDGGATLRRDGQAPKHFPAPLAATRGYLRALGDGDTLAMWLVPHRCGGRDHTLYGVVVDREGKSVAPVTVVAEADQVAISSRDDDVDLWIMDNRTIVWLPLRCR